jgi:epoxyqueuosine reductase
MSVSRNGIFQMALERGYQLRTVSVEHVIELQAEIEERHNSNEFNSDFYKERLSWFDFHPPSQLNNPQSLIVVALPRPQTQATFAWRGKKRTLPIPPTYTSYDAITKQAKDLLAETLKTGGYRVAPTSLPLKLLAARSGLSQYGKNNVCYVPGMGSYLQLAAVYSDMPCQEDSWQEASMMLACESCESCIKACPTHAIQTDRFLLHAERCIVFHNERPASISFPEWIRPSWHNCVVGCFYCQRACPVNRDFLHFTGEHEEFSEQETALILKGAKADELPEGTLSKLKNLSLDEYLEVLPRNLSVFFTTH